MKRRQFLAATVATLASNVLRPSSVWASQSSVSVRDFGAKGDGKTLDTEAFQHAIDAVAAKGGGTVLVPSGQYLAYTLHLRSHLTLQFEPGAVLIAAPPQFGTAGAMYDLPEPQPESIVPFQDFGHNHWHNSQIWGENLENVAIVGQVELWGRGLNKGDGPNEERAGVGNKIIALKNCRNVLLRDLALREAGHFGVLASGVDTLTIDNLRIDTRRDGIDVDSCRDVHIHDCTVNAPWDDAIVIKSSYSLGELRPTERVTISDCIVTGRFEAGSVLDGTYRPFPVKVEHDAPAFTGRIKIGTETNGDIRNVAVTNCVFEGCHGIAVESEDGAHVEDILFSGITMRDLVGPPIFVRLGGRLRGPAGTQVGSLRRLDFRQIDCGSSHGTVSSIIAGIPGHPVEDVRISGGMIRYDGGGVLRPGPIPEQITTYPDPDIFGSTPSQGFYLRHVDGVELSDIELMPEHSDPRPLIWLEDAKAVSAPRVTSSDAHVKLFHEGKAS